MKQTALFLVGAPGAGKTAVARELLGMPKALVSLVMKPKWTLGPQGVCAAGHYLMETFDGADTVPYNGARAALQYWLDELEKRFALTIFDGDRFSNEGSLRFMQQWLLPRVVFVKATEAQLAERRAQRGSKQNPSWMAGRATKAARFAALFPHRDFLALDSDRSPAALAAQIRGWL